MQQKIKPVIQVNSNKGRRQKQASEQAEQLSLFPPTEQSFGEDQRLQIKSCPQSEIDEEYPYRYIAVLLPSNVRLCAGRYTVDEIWRITQSCKDWNWHVGVDGKLNHREALEALINAILSQRASQRLTSEEGGAL